MASGVAACAYEVSVPFRAGAEGCASHRVPAVVATPAGTLPAFAEGRVRSSADHGTSTSCSSARRTAGGAGTRPLGRPDRRAGQLRDAAGRHGRHRGRLPYETGDFSACATITFRRIPVKELV